MMMTTQSAHITEPCADDSAQREKIPLNRINFHLLLLKENRKTDFLKYLKRIFSRWYFWAQVVVFLCAALYPLSNKEEEDMMMMMRCGRPFVVRFATEPTHAALFLFNTWRREILSMCVFSHLHTSSLVLIIKKEENREDILHRRNFEFYLSSISIISINTSVMSLGSLSNNHFHIFRYRGSVPIHIRYKSRA